MPRKVVATAEDRIPKIAQALAEPRAAHRSPANDKIHGPPTPSALLLILVLIQRVSRTSFFYRRHAIQLMSCADAQLLYLGEDLA